MASGTNIDRVAECIEAYPEGICDACISNETAVRPHQQVRQISVNLAGRAVTVRDKGVCKLCNKTLLVNAIELRSTRRDSLHLGHEKPAVEAPAQPDLDDLRRLIIRQLNTIDPGNPREGFSARIVRLRDAGVVPWNVASLALTHASYRNKVYYQTFTLAPVEVTILNLIGEFLREYFDRRLTATPEPSNL